jgi:cytoskeletal protein CcmA (bactofilin family)
MGIYLKKLAVIMGIVVLTGIPVTVAAATFLAKDNPTLKEMVSDDIYAIGQAVSIRGEVKSDVFAIGNTVEVTNSVEGDVIAAGGTVMIRGDVGDDVIATGNSVMVESTSVDDVIAAGNVVLIGEATQVDGSAYLAGNSVIIRGKIAGDVKVGAMSIQLASGAEIMGDLVTYGEVKPRLEIGESAVIRGEQKHVEIKAPQTPSYVGGAGSDWLRRVVTWSLIAWVLIFAMRVFSEKVTRQAQDKWGWSLGLGTLWMFAFIPLVTLLMLTLVGMPAAFFAIFLTLALGVLAVGYSHVIAGSCITRYLFKSAGTNGLSWREALFGGVTLATIRLIPIIGFLVVLGLFLISLGSLIFSLGRLLRQKESV